MVWINGQNRKASCQFLTRDLIHLFLVVILDN